MWFWLVAWVAANPGLDCAGTGPISAEHWANIKNLQELWPDIDLNESRVMRRAVDVMNMAGLEEHIRDCGYGVLHSLLMSLRSLDFDRGTGEAQAAFSLAQQLIEDLRPMREEAAAAGWGLGKTEADLAVYPWLLGLAAPHDCAGTKLRFYVYDLPEFTPGVLHCHHGQWGVEALIPHWIRRGTCQTPRPEDADFFVVPWHTWCLRMVNNCSADSGCLQERYLELMAERRVLLPYWERRNGMDHIFTFGDQGTNYFPRWREFIHESVFLLTEALTPGCGPSCFQPWKDVIIPGHTDYFRYRRMRGFNEPSHKRRLLLNFHGRHPYMQHLGGPLYRNNTVRGSIIDMFSDREDCSVGGFVEDYFEIMGMSHFCLIPMGTSSWTNHLYEAFFAGCIPVILSDDFEVPFQGSVPWQDLSVKWPMHEVAHGLYDYLKSFTADKLRDMKARVDEFACAFDFHSELRPPCSPYQHIMWELERKRTLLAAEWEPRFWNHDS